MRVLMMSQKTKTILLLSEIFNWIGMIMTVVGILFYIFVHFRGRAIAEQAVRDPVLLPYAFFSCILQFYFRGYKHEVKENGGNQKVVMYLFLAVFVRNVTGFGFMLYVFHLCGYL